MQELDAETVKQLSELLEDRESECSENRESELLEDGESDLIQFNVDSTLQTAEDFALPLGPCKPDTSIEVHAKRVRYDRLGRQIEENLAAKAAPEVPAQNKRAPRGRPPKGKQWDKNTGTWVNIGLRAQLKN